MPLKKRPVADEDGRDIESVWKSQPEKIRRFLDQRSDYEQLCIEVAHILGKRIQNEDVEVAMVTQRAKALNSFLEKIQRKKYDDAFIEIEDFAGVRVVCLYVSDLAKIESVIKTDFDVIHKVDKFRDKAPDQFGYGAIHYVVRLGKRFRGARYDDLKDLKCEVQVRTVLQDAWAIIDHHLVYKRESDIPTPIQRKLNGLAGLLETADDQFDRIREERQDYIEKLEKSSADKPTFLSTEVNRDSFAAYLAWRFPTFPGEGFPGQLDKVLNDLDREKYPTLEAVDSAIESVYPEMERIVSRLTIHSDSGALRLVVLLGVVDEALRDSRNMPQEWKVVLPEVASELGIGSGRRAPGSKGRRKSRT